MSEPETTQDDPPPPPLSEFMERSVPRLLMEGAIGAGGGAVLGSVLAPEGAGILPFVLAGAGLAPLSLLLTPVQGALMYRAARYGGALAIMGTLVVSFAVGAESLLVEELLLMGALLFAVGAVGHGVVASVLQVEE